MNVKLHPLSSKCTHNLEVMLLLCSILFLGIGKRSNRWSTVTIRLALAVYCYTPAAYDTLNFFGLLQLPSRSTLQADTGVFLDEPGKY